MNCPVCNTTDLADDTTKCPHCQADLEIFQLIVRAKEQRQTHKKIISALGIFAAVTAIGWASAGIFSGSKAVPEAALPVKELCPEVQVQGEVRTPSDSELIFSLRKENDNLKSENATLSSEKKSANEKPEAKTTKAPAKKKHHHKKKK